MSVETVEQSGRSVSAAEPVSKPHPLVWILLAGLLPRAVLWWAFADVPVEIVDAKDYNRLAVGLLETGSYIDDNGQLTSLRPPLYPVFVAGIYQVFGVENYQAVRAVQALLSLVTTVLVYRLGREAFSRRVGLWAAAIHCFYPSLLGFNNLLLSEVLFTFFCTAIMLVAVRGLKSASLGQMALVGLLLGLGALTRSILWLFTPVLAMYVFVPWRAGWRSRMLAAVLPVVVFSATIAPWAYRNTQIQKTFTVIDVMGGRNAMMGNYEHTPLERSWATIEIATGEKSWFSVLAAENPRIGTGTLTQGQIDKLAMKHGIRFVLSHPVLTAKRCAVRFFNFWQLERTLVAGASAGLFGGPAAPVILGMTAAIFGTCALAMFAGLFGAVMTPPEDRRLHWLMVVSVAFPCAVHTAVFAHSRYHLPVLPIVFLYAAATAVHWREIWNRRNQWSFRWAVLLCGFLVAGWVREIIAVDLDKFSKIFS